MENLNGRNDMFNRKLQMEIVKKTKTQPTEIADQGPQFEEKVTIVTRSVEKGIKKIAIAVCAYVLLDTFRKVMVESSKN
jgi:hypothetical protein